MHSYSEEEFQCLFLLGWSLGPKWLIIHFVPVIFSLCHGMSTVRWFEPGLRGVSSALNVKVGVVLEDSSLGYILFVIRVLLGGILTADCLVLSFRKSCWNVGFVAKLSNFKLPVKNKSKVWISKKLYSWKDFLCSVFTYILLSTGTVIVLVSLWSKEVHAWNNIKQRLIEFGTHTSSVVCWSKSWCRCYKCSGQDGWSLHFPFPMNFYGVVGISEEQA